MTTSAETLKSLEDLERFGIKLGLERISELLARINNPQLAYPSIHIAGTNGKGSTAAFLSSILKHAGLKVGLYTSPHLISPCERIRINGKPVSEQQLALAVEFVMEKVNEIRESYGCTTYFEAITASAFSIFRDNNIDCCVMETGLGGRLDATNPVKSRIQIITTISREHQKHLGKTSKEILFEKLGILKPDSIVILGLTGNLLDIALRKCKKLRCHAVAAKRDFNWKIEELDKTGLIASFYGPQFSCSNVKIPLLGSHQVFNAALAFAAAQYFLTCSEQLNEKTIRTGMETVKWPGRFQRIHKGKQEFILDGAHNPEAAKTFVKTVSEHFGPDPVHLIFGILNDKNTSEMIKILSPVVSQVSVVGIQNKRSADPEKIYRLFCKDIDPDRVKVFSNARDALKESPQKGKIFVAGSLFLVGEILEILNK